MLGHRHPPNQVTASTLESTLTFCTVTYMCHGL
jgi:hypothetical protein